MLNKTKYLIGAFLLSALIFTGCDDEESEAPALSVTAISATGTGLATGEEVTKDLNGASSATDVPPNAIFEITFDREVDAATVTPSSVTLSNSDGVVTTDVTTTGMVATITPTEELIQGTDYTLSLTSSIVGTDGGAFVSTTRTFKTAGRLPVVAPQSATQAAYWKLDGNASDETGNFADGTEVAIEYQADRFGTIESAAYFDGDASIIEIANASSLLTETQDFTVSFWLKTDTTNHLNENGDRTGMFVFGLGAGNGIQYEIMGSYEALKFAQTFINEEGNNEIEDMFFEREATDNTTGGWQGHTFARSLSVQDFQDLLINNWYHAVLTFNATNKVAELYFNGQLMKSYDFNLWPDGDPKQSIVSVDYSGQEPQLYDDLTFGFIHSRRSTLFDNEPWGNYDLPTSQHFKGWMDDFRVFHAAYTAADVTALYNAEKP